MSRLASGASSGKPAAPPADFDLNCGTARGDWELTGRKPSSQPLSKVFDLLTVALRADKCELVSANPKSFVALPEWTAEVAGELNQYLIPSRVAVIVIDQLKLVEVE